ncbi:MAG: DUF5998 family protein [Actinomycetales bacterium]
MSRRRAPVCPVPASLASAIDRAGYYPALVSATVATSLAGEDAVSHMVHQETTFDTDEVRRHVTVLVLTPTRLLVAHADDHRDPATTATYAAISSEAVPLQRVRSVILHHVYANPERFQPSSLPQELSITIGWGAVNRLDLEPASCADPHCEADHGFTGASTADDIVLRIAAAAEGADAVDDALAFATALSAATTGR